MIATTSPETVITGMLESIRRRWLLIELGLFGLIGAAAVSVWLLAMIVTDNFLMLTARQLVAGWAALLLAVVALFAWAGVRLIARQPDTDRFALMYETHVPGVRNRLINAAQFLYDDECDGMPLVRAALLENAAALDPTTAHQAIPARPVRRALVAVAVCLLMLIAYTAIRPAWAANALSRLLHPLAPGPHLLATDPVVTPGDTDLIEGQPFKVRAEVRSSLRGHTARHVEIEYRIASLDWARSPMTAADPNDYHYEFPTVRQPMSYRVRADRSVSREYRVNLQLRPRVEQLQASVTRPAYAGGGTRALKANSGDVSALIGSSVELKLTASVPLSRGQLELPDGKRVPLKLDSSDLRQATARFELTRSGSYAISLVDSRGLPNVQPPRYALTAEPDQPPVPIVRTPGRDLTMPLNTGLPLAIEADDDIGLSRVTLQVRAGNAGWKDLDTREITGRTRHYAAGTHLPIASLGVKTGDTVLYRMVAADGRQPEPNIGVGRTWSITVAEPNDESSLLAAQAKHLLEALRRILALQRENRADIDMDRPVEPTRPRQEQIRVLTVAVVEEQRKSIRPIQSVMDELTALADGPMLQVGQLLGKFGGTYQERLPQKAPLLKQMDEIIARLEALIGRIEKSIASAEQARKAIEPLAPEEREQALKRIRDMVDKLRDFIPEQDKVIEGTEEIARKGDDLTDRDLQKLEQLKGTEDKWDKIFTDSVKDISKLTEQGFADRSVANDYKEMVEQIEEASKNLTPKLIELAVPREQSGREMATALAEEMEMWLPNSPDNLKWMMEEPLDKPEIPMVDLPDQLSDFIGDLIEDQDELNDAAEDMTSAWADSMSAAGWAVNDGPISNFSAVGKTGNQLPDNHELSGRSGEGRSGRSQGQLVEDTVKGLDGRKTPTRVTNDPYEQGVVKELQQTATGGATGGGKARGSGQEGLQGQSPPPLMDNMQYMKDWQQRIRQKAERVAGQLGSIRIAELDRSIAIMKQAEKAAGDGRYQDLFKLQQMVISNLQTAGDGSAREVSLRMDRAERPPADQRQQVVDGADEPVPQEFQDAVRRYFQQLSETK